MSKLTSFKDEAAFWPLTGQSQSRSPLSSVLAAPRGIVSMLAKEWSARRAAHALARLDDRMLRDIGLERSQIGFVVRRGRLAAMPQEVRDDISRWA
jgi:uncharacterized protein YjiS (DUF1127 family)